jgi:hypothetical protein
MLNYSNYKIINKAQFLIGLVLTIFAIDLLSWGILNAGPDANWTPILFITLLLIAGGLGFIAESISKKDK